MHQLFGYTRLAVLLVACAATLMVAGCEDQGDGLPPGSNPPTATPIASPTPGVPTFEQVFTQVIAPSCLSSGCHVQPVPAGGLKLEEHEAYLNLTTRSSLYGFGALIAPGEPENSEMFRRITGTRSGFPVMPQPPNNPLSQEKIDLVRRWIEGGAPQ